MLAVSVKFKYGICRQCLQFPYFDSQLLNTKKMRFAVDNPNTETADNVGSFRIQIIGSETGKKMGFAADNPNTETADNVGSFRICILGS